MKHDNSYEIRFAGLSLGVHGFDWQIDRAFLKDRGVEDFTAVDLLVKLVVEKKERLMNLQFDIVGSVTTACDRCGESVEVKMDTRNELVVRFAHETDLTDDEVIFIEESAPHLEVSQFIYEYIVVGLPIRFVHPEGGCDPEVERYLEEQDEKTDIEENDVDPRWEALKKLKN